MVRVTVTLLAFAFAQEGLPPDVRLAGPPDDVRVTAGPTLLADDVELQWGGQNFSYFLEGERGLFWTALRYRGEDQEPEPIIGQVTRPGHKLPRRTTVLAIDDQDVRRRIQPQMVRTPDGYLHVFVGYYVGDPDQGRTAYFRSARPEDVSEFLDRTDQLPREPFAGTQIRQNVAVHPDGERMVLATVTSFAPNRHLINTPLICIGRRDGADFHFDEPRAYMPVTPMFYPLVAALDGGIVIVGAVHDEADTGRNAVLAHLNWNGVLVHREEFPDLDGPGHSYAHALASAAPDEPGRLVLMRALVPRQGTVRHAEFWTYDLHERGLSLVRSIRNDHELTRSITNAGDFLVRRNGPPRFLNNPASGALYLWQGDDLGQGLMTLYRLPETDARAMGYQGSRSVYVPNPLQGSVLHPGVVHVAADLTNAEMQRGHRGPCSMVFWRLEVE